MPEPEPIDVQAHLRIAGDHLSGELRGPEGPPVSFSGWLGLIGAVESVCTGPECDPPASTNEMEDQQ